VLNVMRPFLHVRMRGPLIPAECNLRIPKSLIQHLSSRTPLIVWLTWRRVAGLPVFAAALQSENISCASGPKLTVADDHGYTPADIPPKLLLAAACV
jgi:hypothetical protein